MHVVVQTVDYICLVLKKESIKKTHVGRIATIAVEFN